MPAGGIVCDIVMHLFPEKEQETRHIKVSVHLLHGTGAVASRFSPPRSRIMENNIPAGAVVRFGRMILDQCLFRIEVQPVVITRKLSVEGEDDPFGQKHREAGFCRRALAPGDLSLSHGQFLQTGNAADIRDLLPLSLLSRTGDTPVRSARVPRGCCLDTAHRSGH